MICLKEISRKRPRPNFSSALNDYDSHLYEILLVPASSSSNEIPSCYSGFCFSSCCAGVQAPHLHVLLVTSTLSLSPYAEITRTCDADTGELSHQFHFSKQKDYVVSMSRLDDLLNYQPHLQPADMLWINTANATNTCADGNENRVHRKSCGPLYRIDCIADSS
jgi:hypothetical protein